MSENPFSTVRWVWMNGRFVEFDKAHVHVLSHGLHYGSGWFEGIRCYRTPAGPAVFRLREHMERLQASCKIFHVEIPYSVDELCEAALEAIRANELGSCYIRPLVFRGFGAMGVNPLNNPVEVVIATWPWGKYLGDEGQEQGVDVCVSSWRRPSGSSFPANSKATGAYLNAQLIKMEAVLGGFVEGIALDEEGHVSEGSGENLFLVSGGVLRTPPLSASILGGITRDTVLTLARDLGIPAVEENLSRGRLYTCEELFFSGTAAEITPIRSVDRIPVGEGRPGPITRRLLETYLATVTGEREDRYGWLTPVGAGTPMAVADEATA